MSENGEEHPIGMTSKGVPNKVDLNGNIDRDVEMLLNGGEY